MTTDNLRIGVPSKGRLADHTIALLKQAGLSFRRPDRSLFARVKELPIDLTFLRTSDIPLLCAEGAIDLGITGSDVVEETGIDLNTRLRLGVGQCRLAVCVPQDANVEGIGALNGCRVATSFPNTASRFFAGQNCSVRLVPLSGSVEIMISLSVADAIVDVVETGSTLVANQLRILEEIGKHETVLVQNDAVRDKEMADRVVRRLEGVVIARAYTLLEYNIPRAQLAAAEAITPGFSSPTVSALEDDSWCAVRVMVQRSQVTSAMERLEEIGATAILETEIANCRL